MRTIFIELEAIPKGVETIYQAKFNGKVVSERKTSRKYVAALVTLWNHEKFPQDPEAVLEKMAENPNRLENCWGRPELFVKGGLNNPYWQKPELTVVFAVEPELKKSLNTWKHC